MVKLQRRWSLLLAALLLLGAARAEVARAQAGGCLTSLSGEKVGARVTAQVFDRPADGQLVPVAGPGQTVEARSGQVVRLSIRPLEGPSQPSGPGCPVRVSFGRLDGVSRLLTTDGFVFDRNVAYGQFRPGEERQLDFALEPFEEWESVSTEIELEGVEIRLPETTEFVARLPAPYQPPAGSVCADVFYPDARPAAGVTLELTAPPDGPTDRRPSGADGRVCWDGFDETRFGSLSLDPSVEPALGQPSTRYVSREASYRLFVVKPPR